MNRIEIKAEECKGCGLCVGACPRHLIALGRSVNHLGYQYAEFHSGSCNACGLCYFICPEPGTITVLSDKGQNTSPDEHGKAAAQRK